MNVDHQEIAKFEAVASRWWNLEGEFKPLHQMNPLRLEWIQRHSAGLFGKQILDVGCGGGILSESMARQGAHVLGLDMGKEPLQVARLHALESGVEVNYRQGTVEALAEELPGRFDVVTCMEMLEHVPDPSQIVAACFKLLKPGGMCVLSTINRNPKAYLFAIIGAEYVLRLLDKGTHDYDKFITPAELDKMATQAGFERQNLIGLHYNPLTKRYWLAQNVDVNYLMAVTKP